MKISIVTITLNGMPELEKTIQSVLRQTYSNIEYIVIDGGSTDGSVELIQKYHPKIHYWVSESDRGIAAAFNKGIRACSGDVIGLINSDDWYEPDAVRKIVQAFEKNPEAGVVYGNLQNWEGNRKEMYLMPGGEIDQIKYEMILTHPSCFVKREMYQKFGLFNEAYHYAMDYELMLRFYLRQVKFVYLNEWIANMGLGGKSDQYWFKAYAEMLRCHLQYGYSGFSAYGNYFYKLFRTGSRTLLKKLGLNFLVVFYRTLQSGKKYDV